MSIKLKFINFLKRIFEILWIFFIIYGFHIIIYLTLGKFLMKFLNFNKLSTGYIISLTIFIVLSYKSKLILISDVFISTFSSCFFGDETKIAKKVKNYIKKTNFRRYFYLFYLIFYILSTLFILNDSDNRIIKIFNNFTPYINKENFSKIITTFFFIETYLLTFKPNIFKEDNQKEK